MDNRNLRVLALVASAALTALMVSPAPSDAAHRAATATEMRAASFNLLGASHTASGSRKWMGSGEVRMRRSVAILDNQKVDVVGFQEMQGRQVAEFQRLRGTTWGLYPGAELRKLDGENSLAWRTSVWTLVETRTVTIPYFDGNTREMPLVLLSHNTTGQEAWFLNVHNPATNRERGNQDRWRTMAMNKEITAVNELRATTSVPVFVIGDMNEREKVFCAFSRRADLKAANGGRSTDTTCTPPRYPMPVDWVFGTAEASFHDWMKVLTPFVQKTTDHPVVVTGVTLPAPVVKH